MMSQTFYLPTKEAWSTTQPWQTLKYRTPNEGVFSFQLPPTVQKARRIRRACVCRGRGGGGRYKSRHERSSRPRPHQTSPVPSRCAVDPATSCLPGVSEFPYTARFPPRATLKTRERSSCYHAPISPPPRPCIASCRGTNGQVRSLLGQLLSAVSFLQEMDVVHRDIKPENILVDRGKRGDPILKASVLLQTTATNEQHKKTIGRFDQSRARHRRVMLQGRVLSRAIFPPLSQRPAGRKEVRFIAF